MISQELIALGVVFYDTQRGHGATDRAARRAAVCYMRRKDADAGDAMPYYEAMADALARRASQVLPQTYECDCGNVHSHGFICTSRYLDRMPREDFQ